jgi:hypothetical protein
VRLTALRERLKTGKDDFDAARVTPVYLKTKDSP